MVLASLMTVNPQDAVIAPNSQFHTQVGVAISTQGQIYPDAAIDFHMETNHVFLPSPPLPTPVAFGILLSLRDFGPGTIKMDPADHHKPLIDLKLFQHEWEIPHLDAMFQEYRRLLNASSVYQFEISPGMHIQSETQRHDYIKEYINDGAHPVASNQIGQVVDSCLRLIGAKGIRIVDLSVIPRGNHANPNMLAVAIGLKGADLILRDARRMNKKKIKKTIFI
jgi:choline dehydrogenase-like flavoprotein